MLVNRRGQATLIGVSAIAMWTGLALLTAMTGGVPPFHLLAMCFAVASAAATLMWLARG